VLCTTIKDSGDDPDVTHGAEIQTFVSWSEQPGISIQGGVGVGRVTKPGLPVPVGEAAINPGPRRLITQVVSRFAGELLDESGVNIEIRVPDGEKLAQETMNPRLGIVGGISILGNTGILKPFSNSAYRASIYTEIKVAKSNGLENVVLTTGSRSEKYAMGYYPQWDEMAFIQVGDHVGYALKQCRRLGISNVVVSGMVGKISKLAQGRMQTHVSQGQVDMDFLGEVGGQLGADEETVAHIKAANTAHHVQKILSKANIDGLEEVLVTLAAQSCFEYAGSLGSLQVLMFSIQGELFAETSVWSET
jgi:cobalt-precorrin-5B (C1)-methyltransferase